MKTRLSALLVAILFVSGSLSAGADQESSPGSGIEYEPLSTLQIDNLATLGKVWGFVKYHHPHVTSRGVNWDSELFRVLPEVLRAARRPAAQAAMARWLAELGNPEPSDPPAELPAGAYLTPDIDWIHDSSALGRELSRRLEIIYRNRSTTGEQHYVQLAPQVGNPIFSNEAPYADLPLPDAGYRLLALFRLWNIVTYWFPYRDVIGEKWEDVLVEFIPGVMAADSEDSYRLVMMQATARIHDTHANLWGSLNLRPPRGSAHLPVVVRFIEEEATITGYTHPDLGPASGLEIGDVITTIGGHAVDSLLIVWEPYYAASNRPTRVRDMMRNLTRGEAGPVLITGRRANTPFQIVAERIPEDDLDLQVGHVHDLPGDTFQMLSDEVAYLKLSSVEGSAIETCIERALEADVLVIDIRNYPSEFVVFSLGGHLVREVTPFAKFSAGDPMNPGAFFMSEPVALRPLEPYFPGKVVILIDEVSQSQAEYTTMALRTCANAIVVGSTTAGADGNISPIPLPGGFNSMISGIGVFYPDGTPTQRVGIVPDLEVHPTRAGIRVGRDEVIETGVSQALGREFRLPPR